MLQVKLSVLKEEKRLLMLKLKQRELQLGRERPETDLDPESESEAEDADEPRKAFPDIRKRSRSESPFAKMMTESATRKRSGDKLERLKGASLG
jgi:hypothetical protein